MVKNLDISIKSINLKEKFKDSHHAEIAGVSASAVDCMVLLNIWETEEYKSLSQQIIVLNKLEIIDSYKFSKNLKWNCIYNLNNGFYLLGSKFSSLYSGAVLALFKENTIITSRLFDKGYATEIHAIQKDKDDSFLISGSWYQCVPCGSHDDYVPVQWQNKITIETTGFRDEDIDQSNPKTIGLHVSDSDSENYFVLEDYGISKYSNDDVLIWNQGLGHFGIENLKPIHKMVPFFKTQNGKTIQDGVWFSGLDYGDSVTSLSEPLFGRVTAGGTILSFKNILIDFPEIYKIHCLIPGQDNNCLLIGETLIVGQGTGLFILYNQFSEGIWQQNIQYINFSKNGLELKVQDSPEFHNRYLQIKAICPQSERLEDLEEVVIFGNADHLRDRNNGDGWSVKINNIF
ncbi:hypothetical protein [Flavobacterium hydrophilum]|uniref:Uncharacterized protein n=1 Tax=Flavobacterium hydrophilum TaxID=2211445 RepID=A0A2V4CA52_9FLAO|nr:hypothetical protein [Flavobacterium hydrophilum]PXY47013.1 hypothetical protein DMB68_07660 [Flavobacterium hydrophilum]